MWIELKNKKEYSNSSKISGLRVSFDKRIDKKRIEEIKKFATWLRKKYYFPIRCNIHICYCSYFKKLDENDIDSIGEFYYDDKELPTISIAAYPSRRAKDQDYFIQVEARIVYFLTFYFQWFLGEFDKRSDRSLKIEATKLQKYIMREYLDEISDYCSTH